MSHDETSAVRECKRGRIAGLQVLYELYSDRVFRTCLRILGDQPAAEDAAHEVFLRVYEQIGRFHDRSAFSTWLYRLAVNYTLNILDRERRQARVLKSLADKSQETGERQRETLTTSAAPDEIAARKERSGEIQELLAQLSPEYRTVLVLREIEGLSYKQIAQVVEVPAGTVMSRLSRAREALKRVWRKHEDRQE